MPKRGDAAKESVKNTIIEAFSNKQSFVTVQDKKIYVTASDDNGEIIQFAISITMPKTPISLAPAASTNGEGAPATSPTELSAEDRAKVEELKKMLGVLDNPM